MSAKLNATAFKLQSWEDVDKALREIAEAEIVLGDIEGQMNQRVNAAKEEAVNLAIPFQDRIKALTALVKSYAESQKAELDGKSRKLNFGSVGFRLSSSVSIAAKKVDIVLNNLKKFKMSDCITTKETINKEVLEKYSDKDIAKIGASRKRVDKFWLETDKEKVKG